MKKTFLFLAMALVSVFAVAQTSHYNQVVWFNGKMMYANPVPSVDSITFTNKVMEQDTLYMLMPRAVVCVQHDTITVVQHDTVTVTQTVIQKDTVYINTCEEGNNKAIGTFYVSADKQVAFAQGNLQYTRSANTWSFAEHQYDWVGTANASGSALADKIDLFGWSANNTTAPFGISLSQDNAGYTGDFVDWGTNTIGNDAPNTWRTLTYDEWTYLFKHTRWTMAKVNGTIGFMLLPNDTDVSGVIVLGDGNVSSNSVSFNASDYASNVYTVDQFAQLESLGCVFLPCAGLRYGSTMNNVGSIGCYWSASSSSSDNARYLYFRLTGAYTDLWNGRYYGLSVRLVQDLK